MIVQERTNIMKYIWELSLEPAKAFRFFYNQNLFEIIFQNNIVIDQKSYNMEWQPILVNSYHDGKEIEIDIAILLYLSSLFVINELYMLCTETLSIQ